MTNIQLCVVLYSNTTNSHLSSGGTQQFIVLKVLTEVVKFSTHGFNYPNNFFKKNILLYLPG